MAPGWLPKPDGSRDHRVEDPTNLWVVHLAGRLLLPLALRMGISANALSCAGLGFGAAAVQAWILAVAAGSAPALFEPDGRACR